MKRSAVKSLRHSQDHVGASERQRQLWDPFRITFEQFNRRRQWFKSRSQSGSMFQSSRNRQHSWQRSSLIDSHAIQAMVQCSAKSQRSAALYKLKQKASSVIQLDHSFFNVHGEVDNLKVPTFVEMITFMLGAVIVPDLSANQVAIKALKKFIAVHGFTKSVLQSDGHSGLLALPEQVGREMSLPTQVSPPYSHQSQGAVERLHKTLCGQVRAIRIGLADRTGRSSRTTSLAIVSQAP